MIRKIGLAVVVAACVSLAACAATTTSPPGSPDLTARIDSALAQAPAPLTRTTADERTLMVILNAYDALLTWTDNQHYVRGSDQALRMRTLLVRLRGAINTLESARTAGSTADWTEAMAAVKATLTDARSVIK